MIRTRAPMRMSFAGGGTDIREYAHTHGGMVLSATIDKYAHCTLRSRSNDGSVDVVSLDYDVVAKYHLERDDRWDIALDLVRGTVQRLGMTNGFELFMHSDAPPGSGLGASSTVVVGLIAACARYLGREVSPYELAEVAYQVERVDVGIRGGMQDQFAAAFGGFNFMEFHRDGVAVTPLRIPASTVNELEYCLGLCYTGRTRRSSGIIEEQLKAYEQGAVEVLAALSQLKQITLDMKRALVRGQVREFGALLDAVWQNKKKCASGISNAAIDEMYEVARDAGCLGGKLLGAGGGGYLLVFMPFELRHVIARKLEACGGQMVPFSFAPHGVESWIVDDDSVAGDLYDIGVSQGLRVAAGER